MIPSHNSERAFCQVRSNHGSRCYMAVISLPPGHHHGLPFGPTIAMEMSVEFWLVWVGHINEGEKPRKKRGKPFYTTFYVGSV